MSNVWLPFMDEIKLVVNKINIYFTSFLNFQFNQSVCSGGLFEENAEYSQQAFVKATEWVNEKRLLPQFNLVADVQEVDLYNGFDVSINGKNNLE